MSRDMSRDLSLHGEIAPGCDITCNYKPEGSLAKGKGPNPDRNFDAIRDQGECSPQIITYIAEENVLSQSRSSVRR